ncbi:uncharacterized protein LOC110266446 [Arachis ipaensis]|uniref:uncharacterized protein LOC110266446 n=1 Tax=Arachis ipaensis TaxID=130454 RepID=UPI000A2B2A8C|nr:uncharacterized protein LOC110266446 [Arachis ipaensis]
MVLFSVLLICLRKKIGAGVVRASIAWLSQFNCYQLVEMIRLVLESLEQVAFLDITPQSSMTLQHQHFHLYLKVQSPSLSLNPSSAPSPQGTNNASSTAVHLLLLLLLGSFLAVSI